jgi:predicted O-linked N-acetylglucosamine transferase (SPINDLY family)
VDEAIANYRQALFLDPQSVQAHNGLGSVLAAVGKLEEAVSCFQEALHIQPASLQALNNLGLAWQGLGHWDQALTAFQQVLKMQPKSAETLYNLGTAYKDQGLLSQAVASFRQALALQPHYALVHSALLLVLHYVPSLEPAALWEEHQAWSKRHAEPLAKTIRPFTNDRQPERRLRLGYVSPDFRDHVVARFLEPALATHRHDQFEIFCYADVGRPDAVTKRLQTHADHWRSIRGVSNDQVAEQIRRDGIDILMDLAGHTSGERLLLFARKPAPLQVTLFGYPDTTGLAAMNYRITDALADPPGISDRFHSETLVCLPETAWCYQANEEVDVGPLPFLGASHITFGSLNQFAKITSEVMALWSQILFAVPDSRLLLLLQADDAGRKRVQQAFASLGIADHRLEFVPKAPRLQYLGNYQRIDICLDPFPYNGAVTTCDALWMGVPVVTLAGDRYVSRQGVCLLTNLGLPELIALTPDAYVRIAIDLAQDRERLRDLRTGLRQQLIASPISDCRRYMRNLEAALQAMWRKWCEE